MFLIAALDSLKGSTNTSDTSMALNRLKKSPEDLNTVKNEQQIDVVIGPRMENEEH